VGGEGGDKGGFGTAGRGGGVHGKDALAGCVASAEGAFVDAWAEVVHCFARGFMKEVVEEVVDAWLANF